jgi:hypothetical protein
VAWERVGYRGCNYLQSGEEQLELFREQVGVSKTNQMTREVEGNDKEKLSAHSLDQAAPEG